MHAPCGRLVGHCLELADWGSLFDAHARCELTPALLHAAMQQLVAALRHVHGLGILHLDVKPMNVLVSMP